MQKLKFCPFDILIFSKKLHVSNIYYSILIPVLLIFQIVEFISVLLTVGSEAAEKELIQLGAVKRILELFFE